MSMHRSYGRMMQCIGDQMQHLHQMRVSWYDYQPADVKDLTDVLNVPRVDSGHQEHGSSLGMQQQSMVFVLLICQHCTVLGL